MSDKSRLREEVVKSNLDLLAEAVCDLKTKLEVEYLIGQLQARNKHDGESVIQRTSRSGKKRTRTSS